MNTIICSASSYRYNGWEFEYKYMFGPWPLKKDGELRKRAGSKFFSDIQGFLDMPKEEQEKFRTRKGGCEKYLGGEYERTPTNP